MLASRLLSRASAFSPSVRCGSPAGAQRFIANLPYHSQLPSPPPREYNPDGSPKVYRLNQISYDHSYDWERWYFVPVGVFHTAYRGVFARDSRPLQAWLLQYHTAVIALPAFLLVTFLTFVFSSVGLYGIRPKRFTIEWMLASKERDRAENSNPCTRYLDRRRKERGPNWIVEDYLPYHPFFMNMSKFHHDTEYRKWKGEAEEQVSV
ncbi:Cg8 family protein [Besnoitia besnoiti]|uniref:Cg8 family protein n=1 Tax=Besnoitia besnoiti TaxID=94643 RepID=A0A2A9MIT2_BESBE|nr:Cg8 family protein [Besnoitia besnoiti]PFH37819.1 Cg8 family protein [Besnoitia besnoiti]